MLGLRTTVYKVVDLKSAKNWYAKAFQVAPYFEESNYVGFNIGGFELGLLPEVNDRSRSDHQISYWGVDDIQVSYNHLLSCGAKVHEAPNSLGGDIKVASVYDPWENIIGIIYNPHFKVS